MPMTGDVVFFKTRFRRKPGTRKTEDNYPKPYQARWRTADQNQARSFVTEELAENWLAELRQAARRGELFDVVTGLPESKLRELRDISWYAHAREYLRERWPDMAAKTRISAVEALGAVTPVLVRTEWGRSEGKALRVALRTWGFRLERNNSGEWVFPDPPVLDRRLLEKLQQNSLPVSALKDPHCIGLAVRACSRKLDGSPASADYFSRRRRGLSAVLSHAVMKQRLPENPLQKNGSIPQEWKPPKAEEEVDPRSIGNPARVRQVLAMVSCVGRHQGERFAAWFGCMYYAMMRPEEVANLRKSGCELPETGWGKLSFSRSAPAAGKAWTDSGQVHDERALKGRGKKGSRTVPIPPELVRLLREHLMRFGSGPDGRVFRSVRDNPIQPSTYWRVWDRTRRIALSPEEYEGPLLKRPYDLRHAGVTYRLNRGIPATQVARWAGHSVEVLQRIYAQVWSEMDHVWIDRMGDHT